VQDICRQARDLATTPHIRAARPSSVRDLQNVKATRSDGSVPMMPKISMASLVTPARVIPTLRTQDTRQVMHEMARIAAGTARLDHAGVVRAIASRSDQMSFAFGRGVAVPHALIEGLVAPIGVFARLEPAHDFGATDGRPADLALLLLSPLKNEAAHLGALACVVRRLRDRDVAARLRSAAGSDAIHIVLTSDVWREAERNGHLPDAVREQPGVPTI
jgi:PTS system nitrogen regulatory IIA component